jgi:hypothetical protein
LHQAADNVSPGEIQAKEAQGYEYVTLVELCERSPEWRAIYERLEKRLRDTGSA